MEFSRQQDWSGLLFLSPGDLPYLGIELTSPALADRFITTEPPARGHLKPSEACEPTSQLPLEVALGLCGDIAERLGRGLQIRLQRFNSASHLQP